MSTSTRRTRLLVGTTIFALLTLHDTGSFAQATAPADPAALRVMPRSTSSSIEIADLFYLRTPGDPQIAPDGRHALFTVRYADRIGKPYTRIWIADLGGEPARPWGDGKGLEGSTPRWSPDGRQVAFSGADGIMIANADGSGVRQLAAVDDSNTPLPRAGERFAWSPDGTRIAFVSATPGPEPKMEDDPIIITRYWYRPASGWPNRFVDNKRLHLFVVDVRSKAVTQLTQGTTTEHSIDWSPDGKKLVFLSNHESDPDFIFNYDIFTIDVDTQAVTQLTHTESNEFEPRWSPDGKTIAYSGLKRPMTSSETNMEDTHVWTLDLATGERRELGAAIDNRQGNPEWSPDGRWLYFTLRSRGTAALYRLPSHGGSAERIGPEPEVRGRVRDFDVGEKAIAAVIATPQDPGALFALRPDGGKALSALARLNSELLDGKNLAQTEAFTFHAWDGLEVEAFITKPTSLDPGARARYPMIVEIHGGPHGQQGPAFVHKAQVYAAHGFAVLMVNYRGSTGYGQAFANAIARDQNGSEAKDVLAGVDAAIARYPWIDPERLGVQGASYGGQLTNWIVTQTTRFKAAIPWASISNLVSHNYMSVYHDYLQQEYGAKPHLEGIMDMLWIRSPIRFVDKVTTPMMLSHGDNDLLVNPAEIEQFFTALHDVGVEAIMLRYPREGHGMRETQHLADFMKRCLAWYDRHFAAVNASQGDAGSS